MSEHSMPPDDSAETESLFDSLARLVPTHLQKEYYRVVAHARSLTPEDEMLRILEAMGVLALIIRQTPGESADERERLHDLLDESLRTSREIQSRIVEFGKDIDGRLEHLPREIELGLNPEKISKFLSEALRQHLAATGMKEASANLRESVSMMQQTQRDLVLTFRSIDDPAYGIASRVEDANLRISQSVEARASRIDRALGGLRSELQTKWLPVIGCASLVIGFGAGIGVQAWHDTSQIREATAPNAIQSPSQGVSISKASDRLITH